MYEKALSFFQRASEIEPQDVKWKLMVASCLRHSNSLQVRIMLSMSIFALVSLSLPLFPLLTFLSPIPFLFLLLPPPDCSSVFQASLSS